MTTRIGPILNPDGIKQCIGCTFFREEALTKEHYSKFYCAVDLTFPNWRYITSISDVFRPTSVVSTPEWCPKPEVNPPELVKALLNVLVGDDADLRKQYAVELEMGPDFEAPIRILLDKYLERMKPKEPEGISVEGMPVKDMPECACRLCRARRSIENETHR